MQNCTPSYSFSTVNQQRTFHHRWHTINGQIYECLACRSTCAANESYAVHWQQDEKYEHSVEEVALVQLIDSVKLQKFILCNKNVRAAEQPERKCSGDTERHQFLLDAGMKAIPQFLHLMWHGTDDISLQLGLYVRVKVPPIMLTKKERNAKKATKAKKSRKAIQVSAACEALEAFAADELLTTYGSDILPVTFEAEKPSLLFQSSFLTISTRYDIEESVDVLLIMLLERVERYLAAAYAKISSALSEYQVQRIEINLKRRRNAKTQRKMTQLPLQYSVKHACVSSAASQLPEKTLMTSNLYSFKTCRYSGELFVVPYLLSPTAACETPNFIITSTNAEKPGNLLLIRSLRKFLRYETGDCVLNCKCCNAKFMQQTKLELHKRLQCGRDFKVIKMSADFVELYERCLPLQCATYNWPLYGIME